MGIVAAVGATMTKLISLRDWAKATYGDSAPKPPTLRTWAKSGKIFPCPEKHGREYFVVPEARYVAANDDNHPVIERVTKAHRNSVPRLEETATDLLDRIIHGRKAKTA